MSEQQNDPLRGGIYMALAMLSFAITDTIIKFVGPDMLLGQLLFVRGLLHIVPTADAAICLKLVLVGGEGFGIFAHPSFFFLIMNGCIWTGIGILCFRFLEDWSRQKGTLGAY